MKSRSMFSALREMFSHISRKRRRQLVPVLALMLAGALAELVSIGAILPFLALIANPQKALALGAISSALERVGLDTPTKIVAAAALVFALSAVLAGAVRLLLEQNPSG
ncbi:hypothetical protein LGH82_10625 [Mesorhizobium sp. PAMC28654]|uniref:hypothetical protein n=1 Tax=Mesorhizobium sp. PAMC28654 TaxID=2880934 RepID=UPI001D0B7BFB|nr:hypothetical protein [Mesorhizobium sp. PAMC28654]UDL91644.1 hypothetical protein LGH82_10625 [Mesorhizobium sp. PAMC28654]